ncbi:PREDICTED: protein KRI1 homolog [Ipomoea nil]|uniref:protein KRI1 homolog n=1 Tax=Ipomoea nil TaxID=35883 RepID=UPI000900874D|nr:PREDICTED: protein KRI1 homolog [Ipomoea nil]XP_019198196.1 PREDICTED: protein KRI1 homolog [Ipomoea nil]
MKLFEGDDDDVEKLNKIEINKEFACRFEHNKKREDLQRFEELKKKGLVDEDDSEESEDDDDDEDFGKPISEKDAEFFNALIKIRNKDPILQNKDAKLFESESESEPDSEADDKKKEKAKKKPMYLKDVVFKHLVEEGPEFEDEDEEGKDKKKVTTYSEEQEELRKEFLDAVENMEMDNEQDGEDFFKVKERGDQDVEDDDGDDGEFSKKLDEYFGEDDKLDENDRFLKDYFRNEMWMNSDEKGGKEDHEGFKLSEDEEEIEKQEDFERDFNFRFEENAGDRVLGHARKVEGSVRKKTNARKLQRERKEERMAREEEERKEELKRLKNLKKKEMREKLQKIKEIAGIGEDGDCLLDEDDLEEEFNPEEYDKKMKNAFGEAYYEAEDVNPDFGSDSDEDADEGDLEKPDFDKEDELLGLPKGWDETNQPRDGFLSIRERILKSQENTGEEHETVDDQVDEEDGVSKEGKRKKKRRKTSVVMQAVKDQLMEEYYKLDYEDVIGDLKTRFKYKPVNAKRFGLSTEEMLMLDDKELNQYVPLKTLAAYRDKDWKVPRAKRHQQKQKIKELIQGKTLDNRKNEKKRPRDQETTIVANYTENEKPHLEGSNGDTSTLSRKKRRKMRLAELKPSHRRLLAFGFNKKK